ncbi:hypothetical protein GDO81_020736 [Engystomops pustulosus]|uniref:acetyl-CoA C-acetyltransferase n=1 Tax=Engystomops pustulosus TaxID=76066 RepID=A0AAV6YWK3_ENGPU|nr:hypothetical protein GDO81_020736 [Engystomops pustulosus]
MHRVRAELGHFPGTPRGALAETTAVVSDRSQDIVIVHGRRTPICKAKRGGFKETTPDELLASVMTAVLKDVNLRPELLGDICVGE